MNVSRLRFLLNETTRPIADYGDYVAVGSPMCHDLFKIRKSDLHLSYALDTFNEGRKVLTKKGFEEGLFVWDTLTNLIKTDQINDIISDNEDNEGATPVFTFIEGKIVKKYAHKLGWPNSTTDGLIMYDNTYFLSEEEAVEKAIEETEYQLQAIHILQQEAEVKLKGLNEKEFKARETLDYLLSVS